MSDPTLELCALCWANGGLTLCSACRANRDAIAALVADRNSLKTLLAIACVDSCNEGSNHFYCEAKKDGICNRSSPGARERIVEKFQEMRAERASLRELLEERGLQIERLNRDLETAEAARLKDL